MQKYIKIRKIQYALLLIGCIIMYLALLLSLIQIPQDYLLILIVIGGVFIFIGNIWISIEESKAGKNKNEF